MKFKQYINEETDADIIQKWHTDCSEYFKYIKYGVKSFRGTTKTFSTIDKKIKPRTDRKPYDTPQGVHDELDKQFKKKFGWKPRSEGVFVSAHHDQAEDYGTAYYFYPANGFKMIWSTTIGDLFSFIDTRTSTHTYDIYSDFIKTQVIPSYKQGTPKDINKALQSYNEVMFKCKYYYLVDTDFVTKHFDEVYER